MVDFLKGLMQYRETVGLILGAAGLGLSLYNYFNSKSKRTIGGNTLSSVYSPALVAGNMVFVSGQIALDPGAKSKTLVGAGNVSMESEQALKNLKRVLAQAGAALEDVVKVRVFLTDMEDYKVFNGVYTRYFPKNPPPRVCVAVKSLPM